VARYDRVVEPSTADLVFGLAKSQAKRAMASHDSEPRPSVSEDEYTPWWQLTAIVAIAAALCTGMCLLM